MSMEVPEPQPRLRLLPAVVIVMIVAAAAFGLPYFASRTMLHFIGMFSALILGPLAIVLWWLTASRARGVFRWLPALLFFVPIVVLMVLLYSDKPMFLMAFGMPFVALVWVGWLLLNRAVVGDGAPLGVYASILVAWSLFSLIRIDEATSEAWPDWRWAWTPNKEERFQIEYANATKSTAPATTISIQPGDVPAFRGVTRDGRITGVTLTSDNWTTNPPKLLWKHRVGPGWGTFSVVGGRLFTQEQRGANECIVCYDAETGDEVWQVAEPVRFQEQIAGPGPRGTPTIQGNRIYAQGATGLLQCLDLSTGTLIWKTDITQGTEGIVPQWGYSGSPLIVSGLVIVYTGGPNGKGTSAFNATDGKLVWSAGDAKHSYSSAQLVTLGGVEQVLMVSDIGLESFTPTDGKRLWFFDWLNRGGNRVTQATIVDEESVILGTGVGGDQGSKRLKVERASEGTFTVTEVWTSKRLRPYFNDGVIHKGHLYGFDDKSLVCVDLKDGKVKWNAGALYGHGQLLLLADQSQLVVQGDRGQVALVAAEPDGYVELGKFSAVTGKSWNHPVIAHGRLYVRNGEEAACYELK